MSLRSRHSRPDPLLVLALLVGLGVLLTTAAQAARPAPVNGGVQPMALQLDAGAVTVMHAVHDGALTFAHPAKGTGLAVGLREPAALRRGRAASGDPGAGRVSRGRAVYFTLNAAWR